MKRSRFSDEQIIAMLKEQESDVKTDDVRRRHGISEVAFGQYAPVYPSIINETPVNPKQRSSIPR